MAIIATATAPTAIKDRMVNGWLISASDEHGCSAITEFDQNARLFVAYDYGINSVGLLFSDPKFKSLKHQEAYPLSLLFVTGDRLDDGWGEMKFTGLVAADGAQSLYKKLNGTDFMTDFARSSIIALKRGDVVVESLSLDGSAEVARALTDCAKAREKENPSDPFAS